MNCKLWDPNELLPPLHEGVPQPVCLSVDIPFGEALEANVKLPSNLKGGTKGYNDDEQSNGEIACLCSLISPFLTCQPHDLDNEPIEHSPIATVRKLLSLNEVSQRYSSF
ncbi:hypothetical protein ACHAWF_012753 [Thalassiosira exigua]